MNVSHPLILFLAIIVSFSAGFHGNNQPQAAGKGIPSYCCAILKENFPPQCPSSWFVLSETWYHFPVHTQGWAVLSSPHNTGEFWVLAAELHVQCKSHSKAEESWVCTWDEGLRFMEKPHGSNHWWCRILNTHLKCPTKIELNTDLGFAGSNPADRALFKRDHSKKALRTLSEGMKCVFLW